MPRGSRYRSPGEIHVEGDASSASYFIALGRDRRARRRAAAHRGRGQRLDPGRHPLRRRGAGHGRARSQAGPAGCEVSRGAWPLRAHHARLQPHPRRGDDAGGDGAVRRRPDAADQHRQLARQGDRPHRRHGHRAAQARRHASSRAPTSSRSRRRRAGSAAAIHTYDDHRMAMCLSLAAFNPLAGSRRGRAAGAHPRPALRGQDLPRLLRDAVRRGQRRAGTTCR